MTKNTQTPFTSDETIKKLIELWINRIRNGNIELRLKAFHRTKKIIKNWYLGNFTLPCNLKAERKPGDLSNLANVY